MINDSMNKPVGTGFGGNIIPGMAVPANGGLASMNMGGLSSNNFAPGGRIEHSNPTAPKEIKSKDIVSLKLSAFYKNDLYSGIDGWYDFEIYKNDAGTMMLKHGRLETTECEADKELLEKTQALVDKHELAKANGQESYAQGLPPEYQPYLLDIKYASGEKLYFYLQGDPYSEWSCDFIDLFRAYLASKGFEKYSIKEKEMAVTRFDFKFNEGKMVYWYGNILTSDKNTGEQITCIWKNFYEHNGEGKERKMIHIPDGYFDNVKRLIEDHNMLSLTNHRIEPVGFDFMDDPFVEFCIEIENGKQFNCFYGKDEIPEEFQKLKGIVRDFMDPIFSAGIAVE